MISRYKTRALAFLTVAVSLFLGGCSFVHVQNISEMPVYVLVKVPDSSKAYTRVVQPVGISEVFSGHGGRYTVTLLPNEDFVNLLQDLRGQISERLFTEGATLTSEEVAMLVNRLNDIDAALQSHLNSPSVSCSGNVPDYESAVVTVTYDQSLDRLTLDCQ